MTDTERKARYTALAREERRLARVATDPTVARVHFHIANCYDEIASSPSKGSMAPDPVARSEQGQASEVATGRTKPTMRQELHQPRRH
jgi:hypothetical protein